MNPEFGYSIDGKSKPEDIVRTGLNVMTGICWDCLRSRLGLVWFAAAVPLVVFGGGFF